MAQTEIEKEFQNFASVFPEAKPKQLGIMRLCFYSGAHVGKALTSEEYAELNNDLNFAAENCENNVQPEKTLAELVESRKE